ncbi:hypothetical protein L3Q82_003879 [Scortum barcoo]|uniref:Uncharacterized protein n=1 Tax=Scortum barcoo TaxID=214431 RepID=A0ACB8X6H6_9TELE|nr:hypothetical protein L3Q82_003879 [Scortum barcoo]
MQMHFLGGPAKNLAPCTVLEPENDNNRHQHKGVQCDMSNVTVHVATGTSTEQPLVGVAVPELSLVGVEDNSSDSDCDLLHASINLVMEQMHDGPVGGHFGVERTLTRLRTRYFWYNMKDDVTLWCRTCPSCAARARPKKTPQAAMGTVRVGAPMERIAVDLMGPLNETDRHNRYILVVQDYFSKWVEAYPVPNEQGIHCG